MLDILTAEKGLIFRITHRDNLDWILRNGLHAADGAARDPNFVDIGNSDLIARRFSRPVPIPPGGTLANYVPFYFTPKSPMLYNIKTGYNGIPSRSNEEIIVLVSSCRHMAAAGVTVLLTDRHAYIATAEWTDDASKLPEMIDWNILRRHDFQRDDAYPEKKDRYMAEALAHRHVPCVALQGIGCASESLRAQVRRQCERQASRSPSFIVPVGISDDPLH